MAPTTHRRRHYFIHKRFQSGFILKFCGLILIGALISTGLLSLFSQGTLTSTFKNGRLEIEMTSAAILPAVVTTNLITLGLIGLATIGVTLFVSHKLAGPMYRFEADLKTLAQGDLTKTVRLRKKDQFQSFATQLNETILSLHTKVADLRSRAETLAAAQPPAAAPLRELIDQIDTQFKL